MSNSAQKDRELSDVFLYVAIIFDHPGEVRAISKINICSFYSCFGCFGGNSQPFCKRFQ